MTAAACSVKPIGCKMSSSRILAKRQRRWTYIRIQIRKCVGDPSECVGNLGRNGRESEIRTRRDLQACQRSWLGIEMALANRETNPIALVVMSYEYPSSTRLKAPTW